MQQKRNIKTKHNKNELEQWCTSRHGIRFEFKHMMQSQTLFRVRSQEKLKYAYNYWINVEVSYVHIYTELEHRAPHIC
jgi:hypothetical protein